MLLFSKYLTGLAQTFFADDLPAEKLPSLRDTVEAQFIPQSAFRNPNSKAAHI
jgi:hypothetical protein